MRAADKGRDDMGKTKRAEIRETIRKVATVAVMALCFTGCGVMERLAAGGREDGGLRADSWAELGLFAYTDEENQLWLWEQDNEEEILLTDKAFALEGMEGTDLPYWEEWEYWQEWDDITDDWVWNYERALSGIIKKAPDDAVYFPQEMRWESFSMQRSVGEREEALRYANGETVDEYAGVRIFLYDLYQCGMGAADGQKEKIAENVCYYCMDGRGNIWYCKADAAEEKGTKEGEGMNRPFAKCMLYRYDGKEHQEIGEINGRNREPFRVDAEGNYVIFFTLDDGLFGCKPGGEKELLVEGLRRDTFHDWGIYTDTDMNRIIYAENDVIYIKDRKNGRERQLTGEGDLLFAGLVGEKTDRILTLRLDEGTVYSDWIERGEEKEEDEDTRKLWELMEKVGHSSYPVMCHASMADISRGRAEEIQTEDGYLLSWPDLESGYLPEWLDVDQVSAPRKVYDMEMIPADAFEKFTLEEVLGGYTPADVLEIYEELKAEEGYEEIYGDRYEEYALSEAFFRCMDSGALKEKANLYAVTAEGICLPDGVAAGDRIGIVGSEYGDEDGRLYVKTYPRMDWQGNDISYRWLEDIYVLDENGNCEKAVEAAEETAVRGDEVFYSRETGLLGLTCLYRSGFSGRIVEAASISLESIRKSPCSDRILFLAKGLVEEAESRTEEVHAMSAEELKKAYPKKKGSGTGYGGEKEERTLVLADENGVKALAEDVFQYGFCGEDSVWILQYAEEKAAEDGESAGEDDWYDWDSWDDTGNGDKRGGCLYLYKDGEKRLITEQAVWMVRQESRGAAGAVWHYE